MIKFVILLIILFAAFVFGHNLLDIEGRVIIAFPETMYEMKLFTSIVFLVFGLIALWVIYWLVVKVVRALIGSRKWLGTYSRNQQVNAYYESINAILNDQRDLALKTIRKTIGADFKGSNYLVAAELEMQNNNFQQAKAYLIQAMDYPKTESIAKLKQAEINLLEGEAENAMASLSAIEGKARKSKGFILLKLRILASLNDWEQIENVAKENKKLLGDEYVNWASRCIKGEFAAIASKQGANALKQHWHDLPRGAKRDVANQVVYIQLLIEQGLYVDAETDLVSFSSKQNDPALFALFKQLTMPNPSKAIKYIESEIKRHPENPELYSVLAHLAFNSGDFELCRKALSKALELRPTASDKALLAKVLEHNKDYEGANALYQGLIQKAK